MVYALTGLVTIVVLLVWFASTRADDFRIARAVTIRAGAAALYPRIQDFHAWRVWSPWDKMDPGMTRTYEGPAQGTGAIYRWAGNGKVGSGTMTIVDCTPDTRVEITLAFEKPFKATNRAVFTLEPDGDATRVTWAMDGKRNLASKLMGLVMNMDELVGKDFVRGLEAMKAVAEGQP